MYDEKCLIQSLLDHPDRDRLTLMEGQAFICQRVTEMIKENSHLSMSCVQIDWFYGKIIERGEKMSNKDRWIFRSSDQIFLNDSALRAMVRSKIRFNNSRLGVHETMSIEKSL